MFERVVGLRDGMRAWTALTRREEVAKMKRSLMERGGTRDGRVVSDEEEESQGRVVRFKVSNAFILWGSFI